MPDAVRWLRLVLIAAVAACSGQDTSGPATVPDAAVAADMEVDRIDLLAWRETMAPVSITRPDSNN